MSGTERPQRPARPPILPDAREAPPGQAPAPAESHAPAGAGTAETLEVVEALAALQRMGEAARALGLAFGFSLDALAAAEAFDGVIGEINRTVEEIAEADEATLREAFARFGADLELDLSLVGLDPSLDPIRAELRAGQAPLRALADFRADAETVAATQGDSVSVGVDLRIGKGAALDQAQRLLAARATQGAPAEAPSACVVFYTEAALRQLLSLGAAALWRERGLGGDERRTVVALCEGTGYLAGVTLEVVGAAGPAPTEWLTLTPQAWRRFTRRVAQARKLRDAESAWSGLDLPFMPDHLRVISRMPGLEAVADRLAALRAAVAVCALASVLDADTRPATLRFAGTRPATLRLDLAAPALSTATPSAPLIADAEPAPDEEPDALIALADWAYRDASPDRLAIARDALVRELPAASETTLEDVRAAAGLALNAARANLTVYLSGRAERYFQLRDAALQAVNGYADATRKAVGDLTNDVVDNLFKTVGLIVGVVVAGLIEPTVSRPVVALAALLYTGYVAFIYWYLLGARLDQKQLARDGLNATLTDMRELPERERAALLARLAPEEARFMHYWRLARYVYLILAIVGALIFVLSLTPLWDVALHIVAPAAIPVAPTATPTR
ncbi:MAG TPA: hypothetical protein VFQ25_07185 [Ktedonobacterales bacterium]|nr:hypothetical protein [Ktedonobacterales bacterium]